MKKICGIIGLILLAINTSYALVPPKYLSVPKWQECTETETRGSANFYCLPDKKPFFCPRASWKILQDQDEIPPCS